MKYISSLLLILVFACGKPSSDSISSVDTVGKEPNDTATLVTINDVTQVSETPDNEGTNHEADALWESEDQEAEDPISDALAIYNGEYTLQSFSEAAKGSLTLQYRSGSTFTITITKQVDDFCSGTIDGEFSIDEYKRGFFEYDNQTVEVSMSLSQVEVKDPGRQLGVGTCEYSGTFLKIEEGD